jgi:hypothetical protein
VPQVKKKKFEVSRKIDGVERKIDGWLAENNLRKNNPAAKSGRVIYWTKKVGPLVFKSSKFVVADGLT